MAACFAYAKWGLFVGEHAGVRLMQPLVEREIARAVDEAIEPVSVEFADVDAVEPDRGTGRALPMQEGVIVHRDIRYARTDDVAASRQSLDIYTAEPVGAGKHDEPKPVMVMIHGGGWRTGDKGNASMVRYKAPHFVGSGYVYVSINYRLSATATDPKHPAHVQDVAAAIAWVHEHIAGFGGDPDRIFVMGHSAGAHLAALVSTDHRRLEAEGKTLGVIKGTIALDTVAYDIPSSLHALGGGPRMRWLYENAFGTSEAAWVDASPRWHIEPAKDIPPMLMFHVGRRVQAERLATDMVAALLEAGTPAQAIHAADRDHAGINHGIGQPGDPYTELIMAFLANPSAAGTLDLRDHETR